MTTPCLELGHLDNFLPLSSQPLLLPSSLRGEYERIPSHLLAPKKNQELQEYSDGSIDSLDPQSQQFTFLSIAEWCWGSAPSYPTHLLMNPPSSSWEKNKKKREQPPALTHMLLVLHEKTVFIHSFGHHA